MPTYVYRFIDTGETIEIRQSFDDAALTEAPHPSDGKPRPVKKVFTPVGVTFKGSGFYKTDSGGSKKSTTSTSAASTADSRSSAPTSSDSSSSSPAGTASSGTSGGSSATASSTPSAPSA